MTQQFMANIRFGSVEWLGRVSDVLRRVKDSESKRIQEITTGQQAHDRTNRKASAVLQEAGDLLDLRNLLVIVATVLDQKRQDVLVFATGVRGIHGSQSAEDLTPGFVFLVGVFDLRNSLTSAVRLCNASDFSTTSTVNRVMSTGMIRAYQKMRLCWLQLSIVGKIPHTY